MAFERIAADNNWRISLALEQTQDAVIAALVTHRADIGIGHLNKTPEGSMMFDFSDPDDIDSLVLVVKKQVTGLKLWHIGSAVLNWNMLALFALGLIAILLCGRLIKTIESGRDPEMFPMQFRHNAWWAAQTMVAHNCGNKLPYSEGGRYIAMLLMLGGTIFTAQITAVLTTNLAASIEQDAPLTEIGDIGRRKVATVYDSYAQHWLQQNLVRTKSYRMIRDCIAALEREEVSAVVYDEKAIRRILANPASRNLRIVGPTFGTHPHAIMVNKNSPYLVAVNRGLAKLHESGEMVKLYGLD